jgi:hypothetical protein
MVSVDRRFAIGANESLLVFHFSIQSSALTARHSGILLVAKHHCLTIFLGFMRQKTIETKVAERHRVSGRSLAYDSFLAVARFFSNYLLSLQFGQKDNVVIITQPQGQFAMHVVHHISSLFSQSSRGTSKMFQSFPIHRFILLRRSHLVYPPLNDV